MKSLLVYFRDLPNSLKIIFFSALSVALCTGLLVMPFSHVEGTDAGVWDHFFTATSLVSINSMTTVPFAETYTWIGHAISLIFMQIGGLGMMTFLALFILMMDQRLSHAQKDLLGDILSRYKLSNMKDFLKKIIYYMLMFETIGAVLLSFRFIPLFGWKEGIFHSIFLSVSAFTNAGFVNFSSESLQSFADERWVTFVVASLVIFGSIGHIVWFDIRSKFSYMRKNRKKLGWKRTYQRLEVPTRLMIDISVFLLLSGMVLVLFFEWSNPETLGGYSVSQKMHNAFFQSVTMRTSGFEVIPFIQFSQVSILFLYGLALIGASPGSTGGGMKTTTIAVLFLAFWSEVKGRSRVTFARRTIEMTTVKQALVIFLTMSVVLYLGVLILLTTEDHTFWEVFIETTSAVSTVGITDEYLVDFSTVGQAVIAGLMFIGRIGPLSMFTGLAGRQQVRRNRTYPTIDIQLG